MTWIEGGIVAIILAILAAVAIPSVAHDRAERTCLQHGWPEAKMAFPLTPYCIKRVNQTDTVVALKALEGGR